MPEGFCNGNDKEYGRNYLNHLINTAKRADSKLVPKFIYPCTRKNQIIQ